MDKLCRILNVHRSGYYAAKVRRPSPRKLREQAVLRALVAAHEKYPAAGLDMLHHLLKPQFHCSRNMIHRLMKEHNIHSIRKRAYKKTTDSNHGYRVSPNLLERDFTASKPNIKWVGDITYIPTDEGWLYAATVKDLCTKEIVGYAFSDRIDSELTVSALSMAYERRKVDGELIFHSDRGSQYASRKYREALSQYGIKQSMSRKGDPYDNAVAENFFSCLKCELIHHKHYKTREDASIDIFAYIETFYNTVRPHSGIGYMAPAAYHEQLCSVYAAKAA